jgi:hypothetical protein
MLSLSTSSLTVNQRYMVGLGVTGVVVVGASLALLVYGKMAAARASTYSPHSAALAAAAHGNGISSSQMHPFYLQNGQVKHVYRCG